MNDKSTAWNLVFGAWLISAVSTLGALFFGEVMKVPTCALCWYQRIFMFPLVLILPLGLFPFDWKVACYALPLAVIGGLFAVYHVLVIVAAAAALLVVFAVGALVFKSQQSSQSAQLTARNRENLVRMHSPALGKADAPVP